MMESEELQYKSEDQDRNRLRAFVDKEYKKICEPPVWLKDAESPFKWFTTLSHLMRIRWDIPDKLQDYRNQGPDYGFEKYCLLLVLLFEKTLKPIIREIVEDEDSSADEEADPEDDEYSDPEKLYVKCKDALDEMAAHEGDVMYERIGPAFQHVLQATRAHMLYFQGSIAKSKEIAKAIQPVKEMSAQNLAGIEGIKTKFLMTQYRNVDISLEFSHKAMELDPDFAAWKYLTGKLLRRHRRDNLEDSIEEELNYFEKAVELERNPKYLVFLAQAYQEMAKMLAFQRENTQKINDVLRKSVNLYRECWSLKNDSAAISRRVGNGMMKVDEEIGDLALAKEASIKAAELSASSVTFHALGKFYYKHEKDDEKAVEYFEKTETRYGLGEIIRLNLIKDPKYDPDDLIQKLIVESETYDGKQDNIRSDVAWYYLYYKKDLRNAAKYIWKVLSKEQHFFRVTDFRSYVFCINKPLNLVDILVNEILLRKKNADSLSPEERSDMEYFENLLEKIFEKYPDLRNKKPTPNLMQTVRNKIENYFRYLRTERYGHSERGRIEAEVVSSWRSNDCDQTVEQLASSQDMTRGGATWRGGFGSGRMNYRYRTVSEDSNRREDRPLRRYSDEERDNMESRRRRGGENSRGRSSTERHYDYNNKNRYDVTITDWRREPRS